MHGLPPSSAPTASSEILSFLGLFFGSTLASVPPSHPPVLPSIPTSIPTGALPTSQPPQTLHDRDSPKEQVNFNHTQDIPAPLRHVPYLWRALPDPSAAPRRRPAALSRAQGRWERGRRAGLAVTGRMGPSEPASSPAPSTPRDPQHLSLLRRQQGQGHAKSSRQGGEAGTGTGREAEALTAAEGAGISRHTGREVKRALSSPAGTHQRDGS